MSMLHQQPKHTTIIFKIELVINVSEYVTNQIWVWWKDDCYKGGGEQFQELVKAVDSKEL